MDGVPLPARAPRRWGTGTPDLERYDRRLRLRCGRNPAGRMIGENGKIVAVSQSKTLVQLLQAPYDSGHFALRMGAGPSALAAAGAADRLRAGGHDVRKQVLTPISSW